MLIHINRRQFLAALCFAGEQDMRTYLNGICVEATWLETRLIATDGHALAAQRYSTANETGGGPAYVVIPRAIAETVKSAKGPDLYITRDAEGIWFLHDAQSRVVFTPLKGKYPDYRRVVPQECDGKPAEFAPSLLMKFAKAAKILGAANEYAVRYAQNGSGGTYVYFGNIPDFCGVIMPKGKIVAGKMVAPDMRPPTWARGLLP